MSKAKTKPAEATEPASKPPARQESARETFESIVVAFVLAFLFRTFIAEAFVIPTGSMAPTLFGRHKDVVCPQCQFAYEVGASDELDEEGSLLLRRISKATCPNCRYEAEIKEMPVYKGDRILVNKFPYEIADPSRWDVCVFKFPEVPERNYIKRMIGLPGEAIRLNRGDVYARKSGAADFQIQRKDDVSKQDAIQINVYDDRHPPKALFAKGWPERWSGMRPTPNDEAVGGYSPDPDLWKLDAAARSHRLEAVSDELSWLRYRHIVPQAFDWKNLEEDKAPAADPKPQLITDYYGYNSFRTNEANDDIFWVGDLTVSGRLNVDGPLSPNAAAVLELVEGYRQYRCEIDLATGEATLMRSDDLNPTGPFVTMGQAKTAIRGPGGHTFRFANVDDRLVVWIDGSVVPFGENGVYQPPVLPGPQPLDLSPVGVAVRGAKATVSELVLRRDIYYRAEQVANDDRFNHKESKGEEIDHLMERTSLRDALVNPREYARIYAEKAGSVEFNPLRDDEFFVMGDNSPRSMDSRLWPNRRGAENRHAVPRHAFVGKAFMIYWPHGIPFLNNGKGYPVIYHTVPKDNNGQPLTENYAANSFPFYPQFGRWLSRIR
ncbi:MAG TPA: signal peptidase I [Planctomycetaceae bacterium]|jgi:signal peptidase I|nr:signal peptidase I [Planctomycetaceae bacterium]